MEGGERKCVKEGETTPLVQHSPRRTQVGWDVREGQVQSSAHDDFRCIAVFARAHESGIVNGTFHNLIRGRPRTNDPHVILDRRLSQGKVLANQHSYADPTNVKPIEKVMDLLLCFKFDIAPFPDSLAEFKRSSSHLHNDIGVTIVHSFEGSGHFIFLCDSGNFSRQFNQIVKRLSVQISDGDNGRHVRKEWDRLQISDPVRQSDGKFPSQKSCHLNEDQIGCHVSTTSFFTKGPVQEFPLTGPHQCLQTDRCLWKDRRLLDEAVEFVLGHHGGSAP